MPSARIQPHLARSGAVSAAGMRIVSEALVMLILQGLPSQAMLDLAPGSNGLTWIKGPSSRWCSLAARALRESIMRCRSFLLALAVLAATSIGAAAQQPAASPSPTPAPAQPDQPLLKPEQLEALVAPIALYPDALLANMLAAATYPLEVVEADRFIKDKKDLKGDALEAQVAKKGWDDSVKALTATSSVLDMMSDKLDWTKSLGDAMLAQQADLMDA